MKHGKELREEEKSIDRGKVSFQVYGRKGGGRRRRQNGKQRWSTSFRGMGVWRSCGAGTLKNGWKAKEEKGAEDLQDGRGRGGSGEGAGQRPAILSQGWEERGALGTVREASENGGE